LSELICGEDYYWEGGLMVLTSAYLMKRGVCCGSGCRWCPYTPKHRAGSTDISAEALSASAEATVSDKRVNAPDTSGGTRPAATCDGRWSEQVGESES
jgi:hypothetical protein